MDQQEAAQENGRRDPIHRQVIGQVDEAEQFATGHLLDAVLTAGERSLEAEEVDHLPQREGYHGEVDAGAADGEVAQAQTQDRAGQPTQRDRDGGVDVPELHRPAGDIGAHPEIRGVAEGQQPHIAQHQVEGAGEQRHAQDPHQEDRVQEERCEGDQDEHHHKGDGLCAGKAEHVRRTFRTGRAALLAGR